MWSFWLIFCILYALWRMWIRDLYRLPDGKNWLWGKLDLAVVGRTSQFSSVQSPSRVRHCDPRDCDARLPCPSSTPRVCSNSCPLSQRCHPTNLSSVTRFSCLQYFPASGSFPKSQFFTSGGQSIAASATASVLPMTIQDWFPLGWTGRISLQSKGLSRVFFNTTVQKHQFFESQISLWSKNLILLWWAGPCSVNI